jgi:RNase H-like domain found in reverse transcriptase
LAGILADTSGAQTLEEKIKAIEALQPPTTFKELCSFIDAVNFYRDMWPRRSHILSTLTELTGATHFHWEQQHQAAFKQMKKLLATDAMLVAYPDHNLPFDIYTNASDFQLGSVVMQNKCLVAYYTCKLNSAHGNYTVIEKELFSFVETFHKFCSMLLGAVITIYTDHCNLTYLTLNTQRVLCWRLYLEEFSRTFAYIPGPMNVLADFFSRSLWRGTMSPTLTVRPLFLLLIHSVGLKF